MLTLVLGAALVLVPVAAASGLPMDGAEPAGSETGAGWTQSSVSGTVSYADGSPAAGALVALVAPDGSRSESPVRSDAQGRYAVSVSTAGTAPSAVQLVVTPPDTVFGFSLASAGPDPVMRSVVLDGTPSVDGVAVSLPAQVSGSRARSAIDTASRAAVTSAMRRMLLPLGRTVDLPSHGCTAPRTPVASQRRVVRALNYVRALAGVEPVSLRSAQEPRARSAAMLLHWSPIITTPSDGRPRCWSAQAQQDLDRSITLRNAGISTSVDDLIEDYHARFEGGDVAIRRALLDPSLRSIAVGGFNGEVALYIAFPRRPMPSAAPTYVTWPSAG